MADLAEIGFVAHTQDLKQASTDLDRMTDAGERAERQAQDVGRATDRMGQQVDAALGPVRALQGLLIGIGAAAGASALVQVADDMKLVEARLRLVTESEAELAATQRELFAIAQSSRSAFGDTADLFTRIARVSDESNTTLLKLTETIQRAALVSGGDPNSMAAGIRQLAQGLGSGVLRGEEFNSVMENSFRIAEALADGLGVPVGALKDMAAAGELTTDKVIPALISQFDKLGREAAQIPTTVGQAMQVLNNEFGKYIGETDEALSATERLAQGILLLANNLDSLARVAGVVTIAISSRLAVAVGAQLVTALRTAGTAANALRGALAFFGGPIGLGITAAASAMMLFATRSEDAATNAAGAEQSVLGLLGMTKELNQIQLEMGLTKAEEQLQHLADKIDDMKMKSLNRDGVFFQPEMQAEFDKLTDKYARWEGYIEDIQKRLAKARTGAATGGGEDGQVSDRAEKALASVRAALRTEEEAIRASYQRRQTIILENTEQTSQARAELMLRNERRLQKDLTALRLEEWDKVWGDQVKENLDLEVRLVNGGAIGDLKKDTKELTDLGADMGMTFASAFEDAILEAESFRDVLSGLAKDLARLVLRDQVTAPLAKAIGNFDWGSLFANADGNAFQGGKVIPFATGGVVTGPTLFPMANGTGLMGEAGPEAIMPLRRGADGKLGVQASGGGGGNVYINVESGGEPAQVRERRGSNGDRFIDVIIESKMKKLLASGAMDRTMANNRHRWR